MKKILFVSLYEPCRFGGRTGGTVILINDILGAVERDLNVDLIVYKKEEINSKLPLNINFIPWSKITSKTKCVDIRGKLPKSMYGDYSCFTIDLNGYDIVVYYPYFCALFNVKNNKANFYTIGMDSGPMLYLRGFINHKGFIMKVFCLYEFFQSLAIDKRAAKISKKVFTVGETDAGFYRSAFLADARFVHHPVTPLIDNCNPISWENGKKLKLCFPGGMTKFYVNGLPESIIDLIVEKADFYKDKIEVSFLGNVKYKELGQKLKRLENAGIHVIYTEFADSFEKYLAEQHIILLPLLVGVGTKNKTLSTLGMGIDMIGTPIALENVYGVYEKHIAETAEEFIERINERINSHCLYGLSRNEIKKFKEYHAAYNWKNYFWNELI